MQHRHGKKMEKAHQKVEHRGKMSVKELVRQNAGASSLEVDKDAIKDFERVMKKYDVDFAVQKDKSLNPPKYVVFFKGRDQDIVERAFKEFVQKHEKKTERPSLRKRLQIKKKLAAEMNKNRERVKLKVKDRGQSL